MPVASNSINKPLQEGAFPEVRGYNRATFTFTYAYKQWIDGYNIAHDIKGELDISISLVSPGIQQWSIRFKNIKYDWDVPCVPEIYLLFDIVKRVDFYIDEQGRIIGDIRPISQQRVLQEKEEEIKEHIDDLQRAETVFKFLKRHINNKKFLRQVLQHHVVINTLANAIILNNNINKHKEETQIPEDVTKPDYFGDNTFLPLKACWLKKEEEYPNPLTTWVRTGGLNKKNYEAQELHKELQKKKINVDYSELYQLSRPKHFTALDVIYIESYLETMIREAWYKEEQVEIQALNNNLQNPEDHGRW